MILESQTWLNFMRPWHVPVCKMGYSRNIPYPEIFEKMYVPVLKWDIPYPRISEELYVPHFFGYIPYPIIFQEGYVPVLLRDIPISQIFRKRYAPSCFEKSKVHILVIFILSYVLHSAVQFSQCPIQLQN